MIEPATLPDFVEAYRAACADLPGNDDRCAVVGAGTKHAAADRLPTAVSTRRLDAVVDYSPADLTITVEAGLPFDAVELLVAKDNLQVAMDALGHGGRATVAGVLAANDAGPLRLSRGAPRDSVLGMSLALRDGRIVRTGGRVLKNVAGYGLHRLMVGSWGRLAAIVSVTLKLRPRAESLRLVRLSPRDATQADGWTCELLNGPTRPAMIEWCCSETRSDSATSEMQVGFEDCREAVDWQISQVASAFAGAETLAAEESAARVEAARAWSARATFRAAMPGSAVADVFAKARERGWAVCGRPAIGTLLVRATPDDAAALARMIHAHGGCVLAPRGLTGRDHADLRAALRRALATAEAS